MAAAAEEPADTAVSLADTLPATLLEPADDTGTTELESAAPVLARSRQNGIPSSPSPAAPLRSEPTEHHCPATLLDEDSSAAASQRGVVISCPRPEEDLLETDVVLKAGQFMSTSNKTK